MDAWMIVTEGDKWITHIQHKQSYTQRAMVTLLLVGLDTSECPN